MGKNIGLIVLVSVLTLLAFEGAARWMFADITTTNDTGSYFAQRWFRSDAVQRNGYGYRDEEFAQTAPAGVFRVAAIGDSFTFGQGVAEADRASDRLEELLIRDGAGYEVLNFGVPGAEYQRLARDLEQALAVSEPDYVLYQWFRNDHDDPDQPPTNPIPLGLWLHKPLNAHSVLYFLGNTAFAMAQYKLGLIERPTEYAERMFRDRTAPSARRAIKRLRRLIDTAHDRGVPIGLALWPMIWFEAEGLGEENFLIDQILGICVELQITCLDLRPALADAAEEGALRLNAFDSHPSERAHEAAARALYTTFGPVWQAMRYGKQVTLLMNNRRPRGPLLSHDEPA